VRGVWSSPVSGAEVKVTVGSVTSGVTVKVVEALPMFQAASRAKNVIV